MYHILSAGFLTACALIRPSKSILDLEVSSVKKQLNGKVFARGVSRENVTKGSEELGLPLEEHIAFCIEARRGSAEKLDSSPTGVGRWLAPFAECHAESTEKQKAIPVTGWPSIQPKIAAILCRSEEACG